MQFQVTDIPRLLPELLLLLLALLVVGSDLIERWGDGEGVLEERTKAAGQLTAIGLGLVIFVTLVQSRFLFTVPELGNNGLLNVLISFGRNLQAGGGAAPPLMGGYAIDTLTMVGRLIFASAALVVTILSMGGKPVKNPAEFYGLLLIATLGFTVMSGAVELILAYIALELSAIALYVLVGYLRNDATSPEAGLKYFLFGALSSAVLLYGMSLAYGFAASEANRTGANVIGTLMNSIGQAGVESTALAPLVLLSLAMIVGGLGYKIAAVPFHTWAPDVYQGAPPVITTLIATASKTAGFLLIYRMLTLAFPNSAGAATLDSFNGWAALIALIALATVLIGNIAALRQTSARRMLAYSGIGHSGFLLLALPLAGSQRPDDQAFAIGSLLAYLLAYVVTSLTAFGTLAVATESTGGDSLDQLRGLWKRNTPLAALLSVSLLSLAGIPPLAGFWGKLLVFMAAYRAGANWLVAIALAMTVVSLAYYLRLVRALWSQDPADPAPIVLRGGRAWALVISAALILVVGIAPAPLWDIFVRVAS
ncbi:MAG: NADH-quinone oxidoreductase subunit N [Roseiflexaceae bacterium]